MESVTNNAFGRESVLELAIAPQKLARVFFTAPFKVLRPFHQADFLQIMIANVSAGIMAGDRQKVAIKLQAAAKAEIVSQSYEKIHCMTDDSEASRNSKIEVGERAVLFYTPLPTLPFAGAAFTNNMEIYLHDATSKLFYSEILACGRSARDEKFQYRWYKSRLHIYQAKHLLYVDNVAFSPAADQIDYQGITQYEGYTHLGTFLLVNFAVSKAELQTKLTAVVDRSNCLVGISDFGSGHLCIKALAAGSEVLLDIQSAIKELLG